MDNSQGKGISRRNLLKMGAVVATAVATDLYPVKLAADTNILNPPANPEQIGFIFNQALCTGCRNCMAACKQTHNWEEGVMWRRVLQFEERRIHLSISCNHCENPVCLTACPVKAYTKRGKDGIVVHNPNICVGCKYCLYVCPYHAPQYSYDTGRITKCSFCYERLDNKESPACVEKCPTGALSFGKISELRKTPNFTEQPRGLPNSTITKPSWVIIPKS